MNTIVKHNVYKRPYRSDIKNYYINPTIQMLFYKNICIVGTDKKNTFYKYNLSKTQCIKVQT